MDMELYHILSQRNGFSDLRPMAEALAKRHIEEMAAEHEQAARFDAQAQRRMQQNALSDPGLVRARAALEAPVQAFQPERPDSYAPGAAGDVSTLAGAFGPSGSGSSGPSARSAPGARMNVTMGDITMGPSQPGAFDEPIPYEPEPREQETVVRGERNRKPLPQRPTYKGQLEGSLQPRFPQQGGERRPDLSPEGAEMYSKLAPSLMGRRNNEETTRRTLEAEQMRGDTSRRNAQLRSATDLLKQSMYLAMKAEQFRMNRKNAKTKDEALKWADQERDARLQAMNTAIANVQRATYNAMGDEKDPEVQQAKQHAAETLRAYNEAESDFNALRTERGMNPQGKGLKKGGTQSYSLGPDGQLIPG